jgi:hemoglobin-like flavoprotein
MSDMMMVDGPVIVETLERVAACHGDPTQAIYGELFARHPELEALFWLDRDGGVRAAMVQQALECILDYADEQLTSAQIIAAARQHHGGYGVPAERFDAFFIAMRNAFRDILGSAWTPDMERAWSGMLGAFATIR